jgi:hypothetical protein
MSPRFWTVKLGDREVTVVAGTREAAQKIAAQRAAKDVRRLRSRGSQ